MHEYTAWQVHDQRMREFTREADASRLAAIAKAGQSPPFRADSSPLVVLRPVSPFTRGLAIAAKRVSGLAHPS